MPSPPSEIVMKQAYAKNNKLYKLIQTEMKVLGLTPSQFALHLGIDKGLMSNILNGVRYPSHRVMKKIVSKTSLEMLDWDYNYAE